MKRFVALLLALSMAAVLCGCGTVKEDVQIKYGEKYVIEEEKFKDPGDLSWDSSDTAVAEVRSGAIFGKGPGNATVTATSSDGKTAAEYTVEVYTIPVTSIVISTNACSITEGESYQLSYTLFPEDASDYGLKWNSANDEIATVSSEGKITAVSVGQTTISISNKDGFIATCSVTVEKALPNFKLLYGSWEGESWFEVGSDGTWMSFDTNPNDEDGDSWWLFYSDYLSVDKYLPEVLTDLGFKGSVYERMNQTTAMQGRQTESNDIATVSWTYHPDHGLQVLIEVND